MSDNTNTTTNESQAEPIAHFDLLRFTGLPPEVFAKLNDEQRAEYERAYRADKAVAHG